MQPQNLILKIFRWNFKVLILRIFNFRNSHSFITIIFICALGINTLQGQKNIQKIIHHPNFQWIKYPISENVFIYYEKNSTAELHKEWVQSQIKDCINTVNLFIGIENYPLPLHFFIVENREKMKLLIGYETNGTAFYKHNYMAAIYSENIQTALTNHELFHLIGPNVWGKTKVWLNEGMAVYSDGYYNGKPIDELSKFIINKGQYISIPQIIKNLRRYDPNITYPILGSFVKFIEENYGRNSLLYLWKNGLKSFEKKMGVSLITLEKEWVSSLHHLN